MQFHWLASVAVLVVSGSSAASAQGEEERNGDWSFTLGAGAAYIADYEGSDDYEVMFLPIIDISWKDRVRLTTSEGPGLFVTPYRTDNFSVDLGVVYEGGREKGDNKALRGLGDLDVGAVAVGRLAYEFGSVEAGLELAHDLTGDRDGMTVTAELEYEKMLFNDRVHLGVTPHVTWANGNYMDNTFGISASQSASSALGLAQHDAGSGLKDTGLTVDVGYGITDNIGVIGAVQYSRLLGDAADSPLVDGEGSANQFAAFLALSYRW